MAHAWRTWLRRAGVPLSLGLMLPISSAYLLPQSKNAKKEESSKSQAAFQVSVNVVVLNATVKDKKGNPVKDLTADDFRVYEDGKLQTIQTFALESFGSEEAEESGESGTPAAPPEGAAAKQSEPGPRMLPRMISIVIDDLTMESMLDFSRIADAVEEFVKNEMRPGDHVAILSGSRKVQLPFSDSKQHLLEELQSLPYRLNVDTTMRPCGLDLTDLEAHTIAQDPAGAASLFSPQLAVVCEEGYKIALAVAAMRQNGDSEFRTYSLLQTLRQHIRALRHFKGSKIVVLFSDGIVAEKRTATAYKLQEVIDLALRSRVVLNTVDTRGVEVYMDAMFPSQAPGAGDGGMAAAFGAPARSQQEKDTGKIGAAWKALNSENRWRLLAHENDRIGQQTPLEQMANETGGMFHGGNLMDKGLQSVVRRQIFYYVLSYVMLPQKTDGAYHDIKLEVTRPGLVLSYRKGYYTPKEELSVENRKREDIIAALGGPGNMNEIPMALSYNYFQEVDSTYSVSFISNVKIRGLQFFEEDARRRNLVSLILAAYDENDRYISGVEKTIEFRLLEDSYSELRDHGLTSSVELKLPMGRYKIKAVVRESNQGKMGSVTRAVEIP
jgi:VWFA-related protein